MDRTTRQVNVLTLPEPAWTEAKRRAEIIAPLARLPRVGHDAADLAAAQLGLSRRRIYQLIGRARQGEGLVTDLAVGRSGGGRDKGRLPDEIERIISDVLFELYLQRQRKRPGLGSFGAFPGSSAARSMGSCWSEPRSRRDASCSGIVPGRGQRRKLCANLIGSQQRPSNTRPIAPSERSGRTKAGFLCCENPSPSPVPVCKPT